MRTYTGNGQPQDYGNFWAAIFQLKSEGEVAERLSECIWHNGEDSEKSDYRFYESLKASDGICIGEQWGI